MKIYAKQVSPEYQESPLFWDDPADAWPGVIFDGNRDYKSHTTPEYDSTIKYLDEISNDWEDYNFWYEWDASTRKYIKHKKGRPDYTLADTLSYYGFTRNDGKAWSTKQRHTWKTIFESENPSSDENICLALELITGKKHGCRTIRGCCQSDWQEIIFPVDDYPGDVLDILEADYFNTGTEWIIHDEDNEPETPEEISGSSLYCYSWDNDGIRAEIAAAAGADASDVILYEYAGSYTLPKYNKVGA